jgi:hypothetical protein
LPSRFCLCAVYLKDSNGQLVEPAAGGLIVLIPGLYDALKKLYADRPEALAVLSDLTGFMWGWACNAALRCIDQPPAPNPALLMLKRRET